MIGVIANPSEHAAAREFFELFKTPWEFYREGQRYDVLISDGNSSVPETGAGVIVLYRGGRAPTDTRRAIESARHKQIGRILSYRNSRIPIYGDCVTFAGELEGLLIDTESQRPAGYVEHSRGSLFVRIGYNLFHEVRLLLTAGQPSANAAIPALDLHISVLRDLIVESGLPLVEIPPAPEGYRFIACLTHDVDHPSIRNHGLDRTTLGFLSRALLGSLRNALRGRIPLRSLVTNCAAAVKLPLIHLGLAKDFWSNFDDRYLELERGIPSTFFVIPFKDRPGKRQDGTAPAFRAARYSARELADRVRKLRVAGCEIGLHGIDAWLDSAAGRKELEEIRRLGGEADLGVRMHWLYFDRESPRTLEAAGAVYDSTAGYNETVGYRAGTTQAYQPLNAGRLLELPLHIMDTALFYPAYLGLSAREAKTIVMELVEHVAKSGGCLTINWHDRSLAPERLWGAFYSELVEELKQRGAWFATAGQAASWFRKRRSAVFENGAVRVAENEAGAPALRLRVYNSPESENAGACRESCIDSAIDETAGSLLPMAAGSSN